MQSRTFGNNALAFILFTVLIDVIGLGITIPVAPKLIAELGHIGMSDAARYGGWLMFVYAAMQFLFAPVIGNLSDAHGRRPLLIASLMMLSCDYLIVGLAPTLAWLFVGRLLSGIGGASFTTASAYIADITPPDKRAAAFGMLGAAFGVGFVIGPAVGGLLGDIDLRLPFFVSAGLAMLNALYGLVVLKESLPVENRRPFDIRRANPMGALAALRRYPALIGLAFVLVLMRFAHDANPAVWTYFTILQFGWTMKQVGLSLMALGLVTALVYGGLTRVAIPYLGENRSVYVGLIAGAIGFMGYALSTQGWMLYALMPIIGLVGLTMPALNAMMSRYVGPDAQGELQGALTSLGSLTSVAAPPLMANLFASFTAPNAWVHFPGAAFAAAALCLIAAALVFRFAGPKPQPVTRRRVGDDGLEPNSGSF